MSILGQGPDNTATYRRLMARERSRRQGGGNFGRLGDYPETLPHRVMLTRSSEEMGPTTGPTIGGEQPDLLTQIRDLLLNLPKAIDNQWRSDFLQRPREAISFAEPGGPVAVAAGAAVAVVSVAVEEGFTGFLTQVGVDVIPGGSFADITWQIRINGSIHPKFDNNVFSVPTVATPLEFSLELPQTSIVQLVAINTGAGPVSVAGVLVGWVEYMTTFKDYGWSPSSGIG